MEERGIFVEALAWLEVRTIRRIAQVIIKSARSGITPVQDLFNRGPARGLVGVPTDLSGQHRDGLLLDLRRRGVRTSAQRDQQHPAQATEAGGEQPRDLIGAHEVVPLTENLLAKHAAFA